MISGLEKHACLPAVALAKAGKTSNYRRSQGVMVSDVSGVGNSGVKRENETPHGLSS